MNNVQFVYERLNKIFYSKNYSHPKWKNFEAGIIEDIAHKLGNPNFEPLILKFGISEFNGKSVVFDTLENWNEQLKEDYKETSLEQFNELYNAIINYKF